MTTNSERGLGRWLGENIVARVAAYYAVLAAGVALAWRFAPDAARALFAGGQEGGEFLARAIGGGTGGAASATMPVMPAAGHGGVVAIGTGVAITSAALLALPVAWVYTLTRQKKGYQQSVVQTLIILPVVVAGIVMLVKNSLALAFSLAGIVAAVRFRTSLDDSKDAVYIFLATGIGLGAGVQVALAAVLSVAFNLVILLLWRSDFGRSPAPLEGQRAQRRLERALAGANRTGMFLARLDDEILKAMSPEQLEALADRAWRRRRRMYSSGGVKAVGDAPAGEANGKPEDQYVPEFNTLVRIRTADVEGGRSAAEPVLASHLKRWRYGGVVHEKDGTHVLEYGAQLEAGVLPGALVEDLKRAAGVLDVKLR